MKIAQPIRKLYEERQQLYNRLSLDVNERLKPLVDSEGWFFTSRVKGLQSYALKLETGRVSNPGELEDFFACTIIVKNLSEISMAEEMVSSIYEINYRRPEKDDFTHKSASSFDFDDLRLFVKQPELESGKNLDLAGLIFEIQIKTILQHAWGVATHDLTYKTDSISWPRERIAFQVKAMLEHAEIAIAEATRLSDAPAVSKKDKKTTDTLKIMDIIVRVWNAEALPVDRKRLAENILQLLTACNIDANRLTSIIDEERSRSGTLSINLSPYAFIVQGLAMSRTIDLRTIMEDGGFNTNIFIHEGMEIPDWMREDHKNIRRV